MSMKKVWNFAKSTKGRMVIGGVVGAGVAIKFAPDVASAVGFTSTGIVAGSLAAKAMALGGAATPAGGAIATAQSVGGLGTVLGSGTATTGVGATGAAAGAGLVKVFQAIKRWVRR